MNNFENKIKTIWRDTKYVDTLFSEFEPRVEGLSIHKHRHQFDTIIEPDYLYDYKIILAYQLHGTCRKDDVQEFEKLFLLKFKNELYSDVREVYMKLRRAYYERNKSEIETLLNELGQLLY